MKPRALLIVVSLGLLVATLAMVGRQRQQLRDLRNQAQELQSRTELLTNVTPAEAEASTPIAAVTHSGPSLELLRLRSQVGQLERRKRELSVVTEESNRLQAQLIAKASSGTGGGALPAGYVRKSEAKFAGFASPEDSLHSFLWAIEHRDLPTLMQFFGPDQAKKIAADVEKRGSAEDFFKEASVLPGMIITGREPKDDGTIELKVQIAPNDETSTQKMRFKQFDGQWRMVTGGF
jgi:hypothetical protein